jgi:hypothetical protein
MTTQSQSPDLVKWFWSAVGNDVYDSLDGSQRTAIEKAAKTRLSQGIRSDIRLSFGKYFLVILFGRERRSRERLAAERANRPVFALRNLPVIFVLWGSFLFTLYSALGFVLNTFVRMLG